MTPVNIVSHEQVVGVGAGASYLKQLLNVLELPVDVPTYRYGTFYFLYVRLFGEDLLCFLAERLDLRFCQVLPVVQLLDPLVQLLDIDLVFLVWVRQPVWLTLFSVNEKSNL